jgi:hypothetical protein
MDNPTEEIPLVDMRMAAATVRAEQEAFELFKQRHSQLSPEPIDPKQGMVDMLGWEFYGSILSAVGTLMLAAFATAGEFYHIASTTSQNGIFTWGRTLSAMFGVEGLIVIMSVLVVLTGEKNSISRKQYENSKWLALFVSVLAGFNGVLRGVLPMDNFWVQAVSFVVSATLAVGASFLAVVGGEIIGYQTRASRDLLKTGREDYLKEKKAWHADLVDRFANSYERKIARGELRIPTSEKRGVRSFAGNERVNEPNEVEGRIVAYLQEKSTPENVLGEGELGPTAIAVALGVSKGYASKIVNEYIARMDMNV